MSSRAHIPLSTCSCEPRRHVELRLCPDHDAILIRSIERGNPKTDFQPLVPADSDDPVYQTPVAVSAPEITVPAGFGEVTITSPVPGTKIRCGGITLVLQ